MKHLLLILISLLLLSSPVIGNSHKGETLYRWYTSSSLTFSYVWKGFGDKEVHDVYEGDVKNGKPHGVGILIYSNGEKYVGGWKDGIIHGRGTYNWSNGRKYVGLWKDGELHGQGKITHPDGTFFEGEFYKGMTWKGRDFDKDGNFIRKYKHPINMSPDD